MTDDIQLAAELGAAANEMKSAATLVAGMKTQIEALTERFGTLEQAQTKGAEDVDKLANYMTDLEKKANIAGNSGRNKSFAPESFKQFAAYISSGTPMETKTISEQIEAAGRAALPLHINEFVQDQLTEINPMRRLSYVAQAESSNFRHLVNVKGATSRWGREVDTRLATDTPQLEKVEPVAFEHFAYAEITQWAARDLFNGRAEGWLRENIIEEFARSEAEKFITGDGVDEPFGMLTAPHNTDPDSTRAFGTWRSIASGDALAITPDALIDAVYDLQASYRRGASWLMNSATAGMVRKLKDADGRYIWTDSLILGQPATLLGYPVEIAEEMPDVEAGSTPIAFGNFRRGYLIADLQTLYIVRDEVTKPGWIKLYCFRRLGAAPTDTKAIRLIEVGEAET